MPRAKNKNTTPTPPAISTAKEAFDTVVEETDAVADDEIRALNLDIPQTVSMVLGKLEVLRTFEPQLLALPGLEARFIKQLEAYALAAWQAHLDEQGSPTNKTLRALVDEATTLRAGLLAEADVLVRHNVFDAQAVAAVRAGQGYIDLANDCVAMGRMYQKAWVDIDGRTFTKRDAVDRAEVVGRELLTALGVRAEGGTAADRAAGESKVRAFALFAKAYDEVRRAIQFLRWHEGDADEIAPSLYRKAGRTSARSEVSSPARPSTPGEELPPANGASHGAAPANGAPLTNGTAAPA